MKNNKRSSVDSLPKKGLRYLGLLFTIIFIAWLLKAFLFSIYYIPSNSMFPTLDLGDYVFVTKFPYNLRTPECYPLTAIPFPYYKTDGLGDVEIGDIVVFDLPIFPPAIHPTKRKIISSALLVCLVIR